MVEIKSIISKKKTKEDKSELLNSTGSSEVPCEDNKRCSVWCMFIYACLFIIYMFLVILLSWILRAYLYTLCKRFLRIENIDELFSQNDRIPYKSINHPSIAYLLRKIEPSILKLNVDSLNKIENGDNSLSHQDVDQIDYSILPDELDSDIELIKQSFPVNEADDLTVILDNMTDLIMSELELVEEALRSNKEKLGDSSITMNEVDLFSDSIIYNLTNILDEEIKFVEEALKTNTDHTEREFINTNYAESSTGFMGFLADIFEHNNEKSKSFEQVDASDNEDYKAYSPFSSDASHLEVEPRFDHMEPIQEPDSNHNQLEVSEDIYLNSAVESIGNLFGIKNNNNYKKNPGSGIVPLIYEHQHDKYKILLLNYLEIFGLVLAAMSLLTFMLLFIIMRCINMQNESKVKGNYILHENNNAKDDHVI